jgi:SAM-dependent methyltransferase
MRICIVTHVCADPETAQRSYESYRETGYPIFWVCFNEAGLVHARKNFSRDRHDVLVDYSAPPFSEMYLNEASYCFFRQYGPKIWSAFDVVAIPQDDVAYGRATDLERMAWTMLAEGIVLAMPAFVDDANLTMEHVATRKDRGILRRYNNFIEELGWVVNTQLMPLDFFTLAYCFSKSSWGKEFFLSTNVIRHFGPWACAIFDEFPAVHMRPPLSKHQNASFNHLYRRLQERFGIAHPGDSWERICEKEGYASIPVDLGMVTWDGKKKALISMTDPVFLWLGNKPPRIPIHPEYWLPRKYQTVTDLKRLLESDPDHIDYRTLDRFLLTAQTPAREIKPISPEQFREQFGLLDTSSALHWLTVPADTQVVLSLLHFARPDRILEIGTAAGHMTANFTNWSGDQARVYSLGITATMRSSSGPYQNHEDPPEDLFGKHAGHFGKGDKVTLLRADSLSFDFARLAPLDFVFVDGAHDLEHVLSDSRNCYEALRPGGWLLWHDFGSPTPWVEVRQALEQLSFPEPIFHVEGTEVAYLQKSPSP